MPIYFVLISGLLIYYWFVELIRFNVCFSLNLSKCRPRSTKIFFLQLYSNTRLPFIISSQADVVSNRSSIHFELSFSTIYMTRCLIFIRNLFHLKFIPFINCLKNKLPIVIVNQIFVLKLYWAESLWQEEQEVGDDLSVCALKLEFFWEKIKIKGKSLS